MGKRPGSLNTRLLVATGVLLVAGFGIAVLVLDAVFRTTSEAAVRELLDVQVLALISAAEPDSAGQFRFPDSLPESRYANLGSGLYAEVRGAEGGRVWQSNSAAGLTFASDIAVAPGQRVFERRLLDDGSEIMVAGLGVGWELQPGKTRVLQFFVAEDLSGYNEQMAVFRRQLLIGFSALTAVLLVAIFFVVRRGLRPLRQMANEIERVEQGEQETLSENYPHELAGVATNLNALVHSERQRMGRFRTTMDDLAHSLKTPLAVLRSDAEAGDVASAKVRAQIDRMQSVVDYQLRRASAAGPRSIAAPRVELAAVINELAGGLRKIYRDKHVEAAIDVADDIQVRMEQGDLFEVVGNLLDNAWKYTTSRVNVSIAEAGGSLVNLVVEDDGPGISQDQIDAALSRGQRLDNRGDAAGQGIGLAVVSEVIELYGGTLAIEAGESGGARFIVGLPGLPGLPG